MRDARREYGNIATVHLFMAAPARVAMLVGQFPVPPGSEPSAMPSDDDLRLEDFHRVQHLGSQVIEPSKYRSCATCAAPSASPYPRPSSTSEPICISCAVQTRGDPMIGETAALKKLWEAAHREAQVQAFRRCLPRDCGLLCHIRNDGATHARGHSKIG
jgi:hypothetical protein